MRVNRLANQRYRLGVRRKKKAKKYGFVLYGSSQPQFTFSQVSSRGRATVTVAGALFASSLFLKLFEFRKRAQVTEL